MQNGLETCCGFEDLLAHIPRRTNNAFGGINVQLCVWITSNLHIPCCMYVYVCVYVCTTNIVYAYSNIIKTPNCNLKF